MRFILIMLPVLSVVFVACAENEPEPWDPSKDPDPYAEFYWVMTAPDWPISNIEGEYRQVSDGSGYTVKGDSLYWYLRDAKPIEVRRQAAEIWMRTPGNGVVIRGTDYGGHIAGKYIAEGANGRPGPIENITLLKVP